MNSAVKNTEFESKIFTATSNNFEALALELFQFQYQYNEIYRTYCNALSIEPASINTLVKIPFLPVGFFKTHRVTTTHFEEQVVFESSGTAGQQSSRHFVKDTGLYRKSFMTAFKKFYGSPDQYCILGLLPSYLEREHSSLVMMVEELIRQSCNPLSGFYLDEHDQLYKTLLHNEILKQPTLLIGVTYALLDFAEKYQAGLKCTTIMETGGMKGRRRELTRKEVHVKLRQQLAVSVIHSEYGMTELLSQAYSKGEGFFHCPCWMKILIREEDDPLSVLLPDTIHGRIVKGAVNIIDLANIYSCAFIAADDAARLHPDGSFEIMGRVDNSEIRGCSLLTL